MAGRSSTTGLRRGESDTTSSSKPSKPFWSWNPDRSLPTLTDTDPKWLSRRKHFFILSDAGKPVYSRYGDAGNLPGFTAALSAIIAGFEENLSSGGGGGDTSSASSASTTLQTSDGKQLHLVWLKKGGLTYAATSTVGESFSTLRRQLIVLRSQLLFVLTNAVERALQKSPKFDPRKLLGNETGGANCAFDTLCHLTTWDPGVALRSYLPLPFSHTKRKYLQKALRGVVRGGCVFFAVVGTEHHVVATSNDNGQSSSSGRRKSESSESSKKPTNNLHPDDIYLACHFVRSIQGFRANSENFAPVCLPIRNAQKFQHAYVSYLKPESGIFLLLLSSDDGNSDGFLSSQLAKQSILETLTATNCKILDGIEKRMLNVDVNSPSPSPKIGEQGAFAVHSAGRPLQTIGSASRETLVEQVPSDGNDAQNITAVDIEPRLNAPSTSSEMRGKGVTRGPHGSLDLPSNALPALKVGGGGESASRRRPGSRRPGSVRLETEVPHAAGGGGPGRLVQHFLYVRPPLGQYVAPEWSEPLHGRDQQKLLLRAYRRVIDAVSSVGGGSDDELGNSASNGSGVTNNPYNSKGGGGGGGGLRAVEAFFQGLGLGVVGGGRGNSPDNSRKHSRSHSGGGRRGSEDSHSQNVPPRRRVHFESSKARVLLGFAGGDFELYVSLAPGTSHTDAVAACNRLCTWLRQEEPRLFC